VETPPGRLGRVDWKEDVAVQIGRPGNWVKLNAFVFTLGFSRKADYCTLDSTLYAWGIGLVEDGDLNPGTFFSYNPDVYYQDPPF
jgi:hypothetical protein